MKNCTRWIAIVAVGLGLTMMGTGCAKYGKRGKKGGGSATDMLNLSERGDGMSGDDLLPLGAVPFGDPGEFASGQFEPVYFAYDSSQVAPEELAKLELAAEALNQNANARMIIEGHSDERGSREYNLALGERRALAVRAYLTNLGVDGERVQTRSMGEESPASFGHDEGSWSQNRRAEFLIAY